MKSRFSFLAAVLVASPSIRAEIGDDLVWDICDPRSPSSQCLPDRLEIAFAGLRESPILELDRFKPGQVIEAAVVLDVATDLLRGYSLGVTHDANVLELDTDGDPFSFVGTPVESIPNGFRQAKVVEGGLTVAGLPSFSGPDPTVLPLGRTPLLRMQYRLRSDPGTQGTKLQFSSALGEPVTTVVLTYDELTFPPVGRGAPPAKRSTAETMSTMTVMVRSIATTRTAFSATVSRGHRLRSWTG
jgi:hypothetical protein